jgi:Do/DeqQ family serine protease
MFLKKYLPIVVSSLLSAILAVAGYRWLEDPQEVIVREPAPVQYTYNNIDYDGLTSAGDHVYQSASPTNFTQAASRVKQTVVNIKNFQRTRNLNFLGRSEGGVTTGSGVVISKDGYIVTNHHVIENSDQIIVTFSDRQELEAELIGSDPSTDLALIKVKTQSLPFVTFGNSDSLQVGEWVLAVGNPFNLESTVTAGIVSAKGRSIDILDTQDRIESFIQTDAAVNPGNSGGALINTQGELVGINTAIITQTGHYGGYSFAIPANLVRKVIHDLQDFGMVQRGLLGVFIEQVNTELAKELGLKKVEGVYITRITPGSGAADAGLRPGDVIISIDGVRTPSLPEMQELVGRHRPGNVIKIQYIRSRKFYTAKVTLKNKRNTTAIDKAKEQEFLRQIGLEARDLSRTERRRLGINGVRVTSVYRGSLADKTNLRPEFVITKVNGKAVSSLDNFVEVLKTINGKTTLEGIYENSAEPYFYVFVYKR